MIGPFKQGIAPNGLVSGVSSTNTSIRLNSTGIRPTKILLTTTAPTHVSFGTLSGNAVATVNSPIFGLGMPAYIDTAGLQSFAVLQPIGGSVAIVVASTLEDSRTKNTDKIKFIADGTTATSGPASARVTIPLNSSGNKPDNILVTTNGAVRILQGDATITAGTFDTIVTSITPLIINVKGDTNISYEEIIAGSLINFTALE